MPLRRQTLAMDLSHNNTFENDLHMLKTQISRIINSNVLASGAQMLETREETSYGLYCYLFGRFISCKVCKVSLKIWQAAEHFCSKKHGRPSAPFCTSGNSYLTKKSGGTNIWGQLYLCFKPSSGGSISTCLKV